VLRVATSCVRNCDAVFGSRRFLTGLDPLQKRCEADQTMRCRSTNTAEFSGLFVCSGFGSRHRRRAWPVGCWGCSSVKAKDDEVDDVSSRNQGNIEG